MRYYYESADHQSHGPVEEIEIRRLWAEGVLRDDSVITPLGGKGGQLYRELFLPHRAPAHPPSGVEKLRMASLLGGVNIFLGIVGFAVCVILFCGLTSFFYDEPMDDESLYPWVRLYYGMAVAPIYLLMGIGLCLRWPWWGRALAVIYSVIEIKVQIFFIVWMLYLLSLGLWGAVTICLATSSILWSFIMIAYASYQSCHLSRPAVVQAFDLYVKILPPV